MFYLPCTIKKNNNQQKFQPKNQTHENNVNINMEINPNTLKKINSKHNKRIRQKKKKSQAHMKANKKFDIKDKIH